MMAAYCTKGSTALSTFTRNLCKIVPQNTQTHWSFITRNPTTLMTRSVSSVHGVGQKYMPVSGGLGPHKSHSSLSRESKSYFSMVTPAQNICFNGQEIVQVGPHNAAAILEKYDTVLLDCDGVVWGMDHVTHIPGAAEAVTSMQALGKQVLFVTNNSMHGRKTYVRKFHEYGFDASADDVFCVAYASAIYLHEIMHVHGSVYIIGTEGMAEELDDMGIPNFGVGLDPDPVYGVIADLLHVPLRDDVHAVLVGYDKYFSLNKLFKACSYLENKDCVFLATSDLEKSVLIAPGRRQPLTGSIVDAVKSAAKRPPTIVGKPDAHLFTCIKATHPSLNPARTLMIGDSVPGDIGFAKAAGLESVLVLSGSSNLDTISKHPGLEPEYFLSSLAAFNLAKM